MPGSRRAASSGFLGAMTVPPLKRLIPRIGLRTRISRMAYRRPRRSSCQPGSASLTILRTTEANCLGSEPLLYGMP